MKRNDADRPKLSLDISQMVTDAQLSPPVSKEEMRADDLIEVHQTSGS